MKTVRLTACANAVEAHILAGVLDAEGIPSAIHNENNLFGGMAAVGCTGVDIFVYEDDLERARDVMNRVRSAESC